jgi:transcription-repair coupling factor (superfamily II helicase)
LGKAIGFEKISLKKNVLRGYFISDQQSAYFETEQFSNVLRFVQSHPRQCNLKEVKNTLRLSIEQVRNIEEAIGMLQEVSQPVLSP